MHPIPHATESSERRVVERVVCLRLRRNPSRPDAPREVLLLEDCVVAVYEDDRATRFPSLDVMLRAHRLDVADLELAPE